MAKSLLLVLLALSLSSFVSGTIESDPGVKVTVSQDAITDLLDDLTPLVTSTLDGLTFPNVTVGKNPSFSLTNLTIDLFESANAEATITENGFSFCWSLISFSSTADWSYYLNLDLFTIGDSGRFEVTVVDSSICGNAEFSYTENDKPMVTVTNAQFDILEYNLKVSETAFSFLYNFFLNILDPLVIEVLDWTFERALTKILPAAFNSVADSINYTFPVLNFAEFDYSVDYANFQPDTYFSIGLDGDFLLINDTSDLPPYTPSIMPDTLSSHGTQYFIDESVFNDGLWIFYAGGYLDIMITQDTLPANSSFSLNTSSFKFILFNLYLKYPNWPMQVGVGATSSPLVTLTNDSIEITASTEWFFEVISPTDGSVVPVFTLDVDLTIKGDISIAQKASNGQTDLGFHVNSFTTKIKVVSSEIGYISAKALQSSIDILILAEVIPTINTFGAIGLPLPFPSVLDIVNPTLSIEDGYVYLVSNFEINQARYEEAFLEAYNEEQQ